MLVFRDKRTLREEVHLCHSAKGKYVLLRIFDKLLQNILLDKFGRNRTFVKVFFNFFAEFRVIKK